MSLSICGTPPAVGGQQHPAHGNTPAGARRTTSFCGSTSGSTEHPRACGADITGVVNGDTVQGTPPHVRGPDAIWPILSQVYHGTPPRMRGERTFSGAIRVAARNTPACAGRRTPPRRCARSRGEHPRVCGANEHVRQREPGVLRNTPARAGRIAGNGGRHLPGPEDPRGAGRISGRRLRLRRPGRNTPACARRTAPTAPRPPVSSEHPRACGADSAIRCPWPICCGAPPACAGRTRRWRRSRSR